jgi:hypothetical protein
MGQLKSQLSLRSLASAFDPSAMYIKMMSTSLLKMNMPELIRDYGPNTQFDLVSTVDQNKFKTEKDYSGFTITEDGFITATFNLITYIKTAPQTFKVKQHKYESVSIDDEDEEEEEEDDDDDY